MSGEVIFVVIPLVWAVMVCTSILVGKWYVGRHFSRVERQEREEPQTFREIYRRTASRICRFCGRPIEHIPNIRNREVIIDGVRVKVGNIPMCCRCYELYQAYKEAKKIFGDE